MKKLILTAAALMIVVGAQAQGYFNLITRSDATHQIKFTDASGVPLTGSDVFVQVFAGTSAGTLVPLTGAGNEPLPLNRTGTGAGLTNPFSKIYTTTMAGGATAYVGYAAFQGADWASASAKSAVVTGLDAGAGAPLTVVLAVAPNLPNNLGLGNGTVALVPEPTTLALGLLGLASLLVIRRRS